MTENKIGMVMSAPESEEAAHKVMRPGLIAGAVPGNRAGLADAYGQAAFWLLRGEAPPPELSKWIGDRLLDLSRVVRDKTDKNYDLAPVALGLKEAGKRGRKPTTVAGQNRHAFMAWDCYYRRRGSNSPWKVIWADVAAVFGVEDSVVEEAWKNRKELDPTIPELNP